MRALCTADDARTDPWKWSCRLCGAEGETADRTERDTQAAGHVARDQPCGRWPRYGAAAGRLLHVWTY